VVAGVLPRPPAISRGDGAAAHHQARASQLPDPCRLHGKRSGPPDRVRLADRPQLLTPTVPAMPSRRIPAGLPPRSRRVATSTGDGAGVSSFRTVARVFRAVRCPGGSPSPGGGRRSGRRGPRGRDVWQTSGMEVGSTPACRTPFLTPAGDRSRGHLLRGPHPATPGPLAAGQCASGRPCLGRPYPRPAGNGQSWATHA
jgi:hypothetical protein